MAKAKWEELAVQECLHRLKHEFSASPYHYSEIKDYIHQTFFREFLHTLLEEMGGNVIQTARLLKIDRPNFYKLLKRLGIEPDDYRN